MTTGKKVWDVVCWTHEKGKKEAKTVSLEGKTVCRAEDSQVHIFDCTQRDIIVCDQVIIMQRVGSSSFSEINTSLSLVKKAAYISSGS